MDQPGFRVGIVGLGLIGGSLALSLRRGRPEWRLSGADRDEPTRRQVRERGVVDEASEVAALDVAHCDLVVLALPAAALLEVLPKIAARMRPGAVLTDVCGVKEEPCRRGGEQERVVFVGAHPMAGTEFRGFDAAQADLFAGATVVVCPARGAPDPRSEAEARVRELWLAAGAGKILAVAPEAHDRAVTYASHVPYLAAAAVVEVLHGAGPDAPLARELAAGGFRDTTRLAGDGTVGGAASLNRFVPPAARVLAEALRALAAQLEDDPEGACARLGALAEERRAMRLPPRRP